VPLLIPLTAILIDLLRLFVCSINLAGNYIFILINNYLLLGNIIHCFFRFVFFQNLFFVLLNLALVICLNMKDFKLFDGLVDFFRILIPVDHCVIYHFLKAINDNIQFALFELKLFHLFISILRKINFIFVTKEFI